MKEVGTIQGYTTTVDDSDIGNIIITNKHTPETTEISGEKTWDDGDNQDEKRPNNIKINLLTNKNQITHLRKNDIKVYSIKKELFDLGVMNIKTPFGNEVRIYNLERTICDLVRNRSTIEIQTFQDAIKEYMNSKNKKVLSQSSRPKRTARQQWCSRDCHRG